jgi:hypothetical protein
MSCFKKACFFLLIAAFACQEGEPKASLSNDLVDPVVIADSIEEEPNLIDEKTEKEQSLYVSESWQLKAEIVWDSIYQTRKIMSLTEMEDGVYDQGVCYFFTDSTLSYQDEKDHYQIFYNCGFESIEHVITVWHKVSPDSLFELKEVLSEGIAEGIGRVFIDTVYQWGGDRRIIEGKSMGGDGGDTWGSSWLGYWYAPNKFTVLSRQYWGGGWEEYVEQIDLDFNNDSSILATHYAAHWLEGGKIITDSILGTKSILLKAKIDSIDTFEQALP